MQTQNLQQQFYITFKNNKKYNMKHTLILAITATAIITFNLTSCSKKDKEVPVITIAEPSMNDTFSMATEDSVHLEFNVTDNDGLHDVTTNITNASGTNVFTNTDDVDNSTYHFHQHFHPTNITSPTVFTLKINAEDHSGNAANKTVTFVVKP
jgi:acetylornithine deacetylase/succinyl-diaminopimelate desuccinylase-like protein